MTANEERELQAQVAPVGLPDDLPEVALAGEPVPDGAALDRIKRRALALAAKAGTESGTAEAKATKARPRRWGWSVAAAVALLALTATAVVGPDQVRAYVGRFIPGLGLSDRTGIRLAATAPVRIQRGDARVEVLGLVLDYDEGGGWLSLVSERVPLTDRNVWLEDTAGHRTLLKPSGRSWNSRSYRGWYTVPKGLQAPGNKLTVVVGDATPWRLEVPLVSADQLPGMDQFGPAVTLHGFTLTARATDLGDHTGVDVLVQQKPEGARVVEIPAPQLQAPGWTSAPVEKASNIDLWQYDAAPLSEGTDTVTLTIPAIEVRDYGGGHITLDATTGPVNKTVYIGYHPLRITRTEVTDEGFEVFVEPGPNLVGWSELSVLGDRSSSWYSRHNEQTGQITSFIVRAPRDASTITLYFFESHLRLEGPWVIEVPVTR